MRLLKRLLWILVFGFIAMNVVVFFHAYKFTHYDKEVQVKTADAKKLSLLQKLGLLFTGVSNPRPVNKSLPDTSYQTFTLKSNKNIESWLISVANAKGTVLLFHGYGGEKSSMLDKALVFRQLGYNTMLVDFMGSGGSEGEQTTIGFDEAQEVRSAFLFIHQRRAGPVILFGTSLGAAAIMKAMADNKLPVNGLILECPFGSMLQTVRNRFTSMDIPSFPMANLLVFWGGVQNGFNAFSHNPEQYAKRINVPTLLMYGAKDEKVTANETNNIYQNLAATKKLVIYPLAGHENYLRKYRQEWTRDIHSFLTEIAHYAR